MTCNDPHFNITNRLDAVEESVDELTLSTSEKLTTHELTHDLLRSHISRVQNRNRLLYRQVQELERRLDEMESHLLLQRPELFRPRVKSPSPKKKQPVDGQAVREYLENQIVKNEPVNSQTELL